MRKTTIAVLIVCFLAISVALIYLGKTSEDKVTVMIDDELVLFVGESPVLVDSVVYVPLSFISDKMGGDVEWKEDGNTFVMTGNEMSITNAIGDSMGYDEEDNEIDLRAAPFKDEKGVTMVSLGVMSLLFGANVEWAPSIKTAFVYKQADEENDARKFAPKLEKVKEYVEQEVGEYDVEYLNSYTKNGQRCHKYAIFNTDSKDIFYFLYYDETSRYEMLEAKNHLQ